MDPPTPSRRLGDTLVEIVRTVVTYIGGQALVAAIMTVLYALAFWLLHLPLWFVVAPLCGLMHIVPMVGALLAVGIPLLVVLFSDGGWEQAAWVLGIFGAAQALEGLVLSPVIHGKRLKLHPGLVFLAVLAGSTLFGFFGALVAVPALAVAVLIWRALSAASDSGSPPSSR